ncbi:MAG: hypothetical protein HOW73_38070 [Polyangiaceae bacterium]|nr:hypothetical protein [Polyangiaceae bacterium]
MNTTVPVGSFASRMEADLARLRLEAEGIRATVDEQLAFNPILGEATGAARLIVRAKDEQRALEILDTPLLDAPDPADGYRTPGTREEDEPEVVRCPQCEHEYCFFERPNIAGLSLYVLGPLGFLATLLPIGQKRWRCRTCRFAWDDLALCPKTKTPISPDDPRPVFRLRRSRAGTGFFIGLIAYMCTKMIGTSPMLDLAAPLLIVGGFLVGLSITSDVCSEPTCRAPFPRDITRCPKCKGEIAGVINRAHQHFAEVTRFRRELAQAALVVHDSAPPQPKKSNKPRKRRREPS